MVHCLEEQSCQFTVCFILEIHHDGLLFQRPSLDPVVCWHVQALPRRQSDFQNLCVLSQWILFLVQPNKKVQRRLGRVEFVQYSRVDCLFKRGRDYCEFFFALDQAIVPFSFLPLRPAVERLPNGQSGVPVSQHLCDESGPRIVGFYLGVDYNLTFEEVNGLSFLSAIFRLA